MSKPWTWSIASHGPKEGVIHSLEQQRDSRDVNHPNLDEASMNRFDAAMAEAIETVGEFGDGVTVSVSVSGHGEDHIATIKKHDPKEPLDLAAFVAALEKSPAELDKFKKNKKAVKALLKMLGEK